MLPVLFTERATEDLVGAVGYVLERNVRAAIALRKEIDGALALLAEGILEGARVTLITGEEVRRWVVSPLVIYYQRRPDALVVLYLHDGRRAPLQR
jgi:plasmid stabilization system protein ParE